LHFSNIYAVVKLNRFLSLTDLIYNGTDITSPTIQSGEDNQILQHRWLPPICIHFHRLPTMEMDTYFITLLTFYIILTTVTLSDFYSLDPWLLHSFFLFFIFHFYCVICHWRRPYKSKRVWFVSLLFTIYLFILYIYLCRSFLDLSCCI